MNQKQFTSVSFNFFYFADDAVYTWLLNVAVGAWRSKIIFSHGAV